MLLSAIGITRYPLNLRQGSPYRSAPVVRRVDKGTTLRIVERLEGENVEGVSVWYREVASGAYFWGGGVDLTELLSNAPSAADYLPNPAKIELTRSGFPFQVGTTPAEDARRVQEWLSFHGHSLAIDDDFGQATQRAVSAYERQIGLPETGRVSAELFRLLTEPMQRALRKPVLPAGTVFAKWVLMVARQHLDEHPLEIGGDNCGPWVRLYMEGQQGHKQYWCAGFVTTMLQQAEALSGSAKPLPGAVGCDELATQASARGRLLSAADTLRAGNLPKTEGQGCWIFLARNQHNAADYVHTGLALEFDATTFKTIEGNTNDEGSRNGYEVCSRTRMTANYDFIRLD